MTVRNIQSANHDRVMQLVKCPHCEHELPEGVDIACWPNPPWVTVCAKCPFCNIGLSFFVMPSVVEQAATSQPS